MKAARPMRSMLQRAPQVALLFVAGCAGAAPNQAKGSAAMPAGEASSAAPAGAASSPLGPSPIGRMAHIPATTYRMGSEVGEPDELPVHSVQVAPFDMDLTEVTVGQYAGCVRAGACAPAGKVVVWPDVTFDDQQLSGGKCNEDRADRQDHPVNCVSWAMADAYCRWAGKRLPTEEEWEYAACGGDCDAAMKSQVGRSGTHGAEQWPYTARVASTWPGPFGLYDMAGNVWEWTASAYCPYDHPSCGDKRRVVRGGSWVMVDYLFVRLTDRSASDPSTRNTNLGFRCVRP